MVRVERRFEPDQKLSARYEEKFDIYKSVYKALVEAGVYERLAALES